MNKMMIGYGDGVFFTVQKIYFNVSEPMNDK